MFTSLFLQYYSEKVNSNLENSSPEKWAISIYKFLLLFGKKFFDQIIFICVSQWKNISTSFLDITINQWYIIINAWKYIYLFPTIRRQIKHQNRQKTNTHARYYQVDSIEQSFSPHRYIKCNIQIRFITARVKFFIPENKIRNILQKSCYTVTLNESRIQLEQSK